LNSQRFHKIAHLIASPFALKQTQKILPIAFLLATVGLGIYFKPNGGDGAIALSSTRRVFKANCLFGLEIED
jgi:hypothetical protein